MQLSGILELGCSGLTYFIAMINSFNKTEAAISPVQPMLALSLPFYQFLKQMTDVKPFVGVRNMWARSLTVAFFIRRQQIITVLHINDRLTNQLTQHL